MKTFVELFTKPSANQSSSSSSSRPRLGPGPGGLSTSRMGNGPAHGPGTNLKRTAAEAGPGGSSISSTGEKRQNTTGSSVPSTGGQIQKRPNIFEKIPDEVIDVILEFAGAQGLQLRAVCKWFSTIVREKTKILSLNLAKFRHLHSEDVENLFAKHTQLRDFRLSGLNGSLSGKVMCTVAHLCKLHTLSFHKCPEISDAVLKRLLKASTDRDVFTSLKRVCFVGCRKLSSVSLSGMDKPFRALEEFHVGPLAEPENSKFDDSIFAGVNSRLQKLTVLNSRLVTCQAVSTRNMRCLTYVDVQGCGVVSLMPFYNQPLRVLNVADNPGTDSATIRTFLHSRASNTLERLDLSALVLPADMKLPPDNASDQNQQPRFPVLPALTTLRLANCSMISENTNRPVGQYLSALDFVGELGALKTLDITRLPINPSDIGAEYLYRGPKMALLAGVNDSNLGEMTSFCRFINETLTLNPKFQEALGNVSLPTLRVVNHQFFVTPNLDSIQPWATDTIFS